MNNLGETFIHFDLLKLCLNQYRCCCRDTIWIKSNRKEIKLTKKKDEMTIRSSVAKYLTYVTSVGDQKDSIEMCYEDENVLL